MKKKWAYLAATLLLAGCAEDAFEDVNMQETTELQEIKLFAGTAGLEVESRGAGTVGGLVDDAAANVWKGQKLTIWGIKNNATNLGTDDASNVYLAGVTATAPTDETTGAVALTGGPLYYPLQGAFNFTGYYIDDAANGEVTRTATAITQAVKIDGSQDIMIAKAELTAAQKITLVESLIEYGKLTENTTEYVDATTAAFVTGITDENKTLIEQEYKKAFSSYTARRGVQPEMTFQHQLARLEFSVIAGDANAQGSDTKVTIDSEDYTKGILIKEIKIKSAQTEGIITIDNVGNITFAADANATAGELTLKSSEKDATTGLLNPLAETAPAGLYNKDGVEDASTKKNIYTKVGESILAFPEDQYTVDIKTIQYVQEKKDAPGTYEIVKESGATAAGKETSYTNVTIKLPNDAQSNPQTFLAGHTYNIKVKVYSNQEIVITATLNGWLEGDEVVISPEDDLFDQEFNSSTNSGTNSGTGTTAP